MSLIEPILHDCRIDILREFHSESEKLTKEFTEAFQELICRVMEILFQSENLITYQMRHLLYFLRINATEKFSDIARYVFIRQAINQWEL